MVVQYEVPVLQRKMAIDMEETCRVLKELEDDSWHRDSFENISINDAVTRAAGVTRIPVDLLSESPSSSKRLMSPSSAGSSSPLSNSTASPSFRSGCVDPFGAKAATSHRRLKKRMEGGQGHSSLACACKGDFRPSRWDSGRWSGTSTFDERCTKPRGKSICKCAAGLTADVAAVCCCPLSVLHLLAIAFIKLPSVMLARAISKIKRKLKNRSKRATVHEEEDESVPPSPCRPSRARSYEAGDINTWAPALGFGDQCLWRDYFDSPDTHVGSNGDCVKAKS